METKYYVEIKGIGDIHWSRAGLYSTLKKARERYNFFKSGCEKRIRKVTIIHKEEVIAKKKY